jgi:hypothetical protein
MEQYLTTRSSLPGRPLDLWMGSPPGEWPGLRRGLWPILTLLVLLAGCGPRQAPRHPNAGGVLLTDEVLGAAGGSRQLAALTVALNTPPAELRTYVDPEVDNGVLLLDVALTDDPGSYESPIGKVFQVRGNMRGLIPRRDISELPEGLDEIWEGFVIDLTRRQPYYILYAGTPDASLETRLVVATGIYIGVREYVSQTDVKRQAPIIVTRDLRRVR